VRFQADELVKRFLQASRRLLSCGDPRGEVGPDEEIKLIAGEPNAIPVSDCKRLDHAVGLWLGTLDSMLPAPNEAL
jgi:hypothetical protein